MEARRILKPLIRAGVILGVGLGGFVDGILFHQILQTHNMLTGRLPKKSLADAEVQMFWDGLFHSFTWVMVLVGVILLFRVRNVRNILWSGKAFTGSLFLGWGIFNGIEGLINHHILHLHHVVEQKGESVYDLLFLLSGIIFSVAGWLAIRSARSQEMKTP